MKTKATFINTSIIFLIMLIIGLSFSTVYASEELSMKCETTFQEKVIIIENNTVALKEPMRKGRSISSVHNSRTHVTQKGFNKILYIDGLKHKIHIDNIQDPSEINDFMAITSPKGHKMTYPISCKVI